MIMASCSEAKYRDGKKAVEFATIACELTDWNRSIYLDTLAAAYAEAGDFDAAVRWQSRAIEIVSDETQKGDYRRRLALYQAGRPYREVFQLLAPTEARP
jgi:serine/threonine-protein kinase